MPHLERHGGVYKIPCSSCNSSHIGQTGRRLTQRLHEHRQAVRQADFNSSALAEHAWACDDPVNWYNVQVLSNPRDHTARIIQEAVFIARLMTHRIRDNGALTSEYDILFNSN